MCQREGRAECVLSMPVCWALGKGHLGIYFTYSPCRKLLTSFTGGSTSVRSLNNLLVVPLLK